MTQIHTNSNFIDEMTDSRKQLQFKTKKAQTFQPVLHCSKSIYFLFYKYPVFPRS